MTTFVKYARRHNDDSTIDSICTKCYQTVAHGDRTAEFRLDSAERDHNCNLNGEFNHIHWRKFDGSV